MGNLLTSILNTAGAMDVYDRQLAAVQNNITNASTPGYARQTQTVGASPFQPDIGLTGGIRAGQVESARSEYAEESVRLQTSLSSAADQKTADLTQVQSLFDLTSSYGISNSITKFFQSFSQLAVNPNDSTTRQTVIDSASTLAQSFNQTASGLNNAAGNADKQVQSSVDAINKLAGQIRDLNATRLNNYDENKDAGLDAQVHTTLEQLSQYGNVSAIQQPDGTTSVYLGGQTALVIADHQFNVQADLSTTTTKVLDANGADISKQITSGKLGALLDEKNTLIPGYLAKLNTLSHTLSDDVNLKLQGGLDSNGASPTIDLFSYNSTIGEAASMSVTAITPDQIAAASAGAAGGNGNALDIAAMLDAKQMNGSTYTQFYGTLGGQVGTDVSNAEQQQTTQSSMLTQAKSLRDQISGVDINQEAAQLMQIQRAYQAVGKVLSVLNDITSTLMAIPVGS